MRFNSFSPVVLASALASLFAGTASNMQLALANARAQSRHQPEPAATSNPAGLGTYRKARVSRASAKRAAAKRRNVLRNKRAHQRAGRRAGR